MARDTIIIFPPWLLRDPPSGERPMSRWECREIVGDLPWRLCSRCHSGAWLARSLGEGVRVLLLIPPGPLRGTERKCDIEYTLFILQRIRESHDRCPCNCFTLCANEVERDFSNRQNNLYNDSKFSFYKNDSGWVKELLWKWWWTGQRQHVENINLDHFKI